MVDGFGLKVEVEFAHFFDLSLLEQVFSEFEHFVDVLVLHITLEELLELSGVVEGAERTDWVGCSVGVLLHLCFLKEKGLV